MELMTIKQFAEDQHVSYEAIRRQLVTYKNDLEGHIIRKGRTQFLDETAVEFLRSKRKEHPVIVIQQDYRAEIQELQQELDSMRDRVIKLQDKLIEITEENMELLEYRGKNQMLLELRKDDQEKIQEIQKENESLHSQVSEIKEQLQEAKTEAESYHRSWFGFYRKKV